MGSFHECQDQPTGSRVYSRKSFGRLRICLDPKDPDRAIKRPHYHTRTLEEIIHKLAGATVFSKPPRLLVGLARPRVQYEDHLQQPNSQQGATPTTIRSSALALCYSAAENACPVWESSSHANKLDATLNETSRMITGCLKPTITNSLPVLAGIAPSDIRQVAASRTERTRQTVHQTHTLNGNLGVAPRLKSWKNNFITFTEPINTTAKAARMDL